MLSCTNSSERRVPMRAPHSLLQIAVANWQKSAAEFMAYSVWFMRFLYHM